MIQKAEIVKIRTLKGRVVTLTVSSVSDTHISGVDKFGSPTILRLDEIDTMLPVRGVES